MGSNEIDDKELFVKVQWEEEGYVNVVPVKLNHRGEISKYSYKDLHRVIRSECSLDGKRLVYIDDEGDEIPFEERYRLNIGMHTNAFSTMRPDIRLIHICVQNATHPPNKHWCTSIASQPLDEQRTSVPLPMQAVFCELEKLFCKALGLKADMIGSASCSSQMPNQEHEEGGDKDVEELGVAKESEQDDSSSYEVVSGV